MTAVYTLERLVCHYHFQWLKSSISNIFRDGNSRILQFIKMLLTYCIK